MRRSPTKFRRVRTCGSGPDCALQFFGLRRRSGSGRMARPPASQRGAASSSKPASTANGAATAEAASSSTPDAAAAAEEEPCHTGAVVMMPMDGNCLFHALFHELRRLRLAADVPNAHVLRLRLTDWVSAHGQKAECASLTLSQWIELETEEALERYVARLQRNGEWGGIVELYAVTELFDVTTCVWEPLGRTPAGGWRYTRRHSLEGSSARSRRDERNGSRTVHLHYNGSSHYSVFVPDESSSTAPTIVAAQKPAAAASVEAPSAAACKTGEAGEVTGKVGASSVRRLTKSARSPTTLSSHSTAGSHLDDRSMPAGRVLGSSTQRAAGATSRRGAASTLTASRRPYLTQPTQPSMRALQLPLSSSSRVHLTSSRPARARIAPLAAKPSSFSGKRPFSELSHAVKLSFRLERGSGLPARPREVRV